MLQCPQQTFARLFYNASSSFLLLFIFFHFTSIFLAKLFIFFGGNPFYQRNQDEYEFDEFSDEEMEEENEYYGPKSMDEKDHLVADISNQGGNHNLETVSVNDEEYSSEEIISDNSSETTSYSTPPDIESGSDNGEEIVEEEIVLPRDTDSSCDSDDQPNENNDPTSRNGHYIKKTTLEEIHHANHHREAFPEKKLEMNFRQEENYLVYQPPVSETGKKLVKEKDEDEGEIFGDTFTIGSTSKDSSEWRSSINCRDSGTDDPFSSSSRRSCPKWESYTVFQKYDEEMLFLDRISAQKLHETESLRSIQACPRSISERIIHKLGSRSQKTSEFRHNPYHELESAYVAQICLTWEALNWNYKYFQRLRASRKEFDPGCPAYVAQQFQQFQVLLQRYVENEPYEHGRRPEIYARMRSLAPKLLQVPEYRVKQHNYITKPMILVWKY